MMRRKSLVANWKMNKSLHDLESYVAGLRKQGIFDQDRVDCVLAPPFPFLQKMSELLRGSRVGLCAQDVFWEQKGAYTGEVSVSMLKDLGVSHVIVGHSERRQYFAETDEIVAKKTKACVENGLVSICCIGESLEERRSDRTISVLERQLAPVLAGLSSSNLLMIAYEPVWAIGTGVSASVQEAVEVHRFVRKRVKNSFGDEAGEKISILYGGSMNSANTLSLLSEKDIDGGLVGGASLEADSFASMFRAILQ